MNTFKIKDIEFEYFYHNYNNTGRNERKVEIALAKYFLCKFSNEIEIGAVTPYYFNIRHDVYDPYDPHPCCKKEDVFTVDFTDRNILSISTIEHMGRAEYGNTNIDYTMDIRCLEKIIKEASCYLVTFPIGWNSGLEKYVRENVTKKFGMNRFDNDHWKVCPCDEEFYKAKWGFPFEAGNNLCVITNLEELL